MMFLLLFWTFISSASAHFFSCIGLVVVVNTGLTTSQLLFSILQLSNYNIVYTTLLVILALVLIFLGIYLWNYLFKKAVDKRVALLSEESQPNDISLQPFGFDEDDDTFFSSETINFIKNKHNNPQQETDQKTKAFKSSPPFNQSANRYREYAQMLPDIVFECDLEGNLIFTNKIALDTLGIDALDIERKRLSIFNFFHPDDIEKAKENLGRMAENIKGIDAEYRIYNRKKGIIHVLAYTLPVVRSGKVIGVRGLLVDISQRKKNEETIKTLQDIVSHVGLGINVFSQEDPADPTSFKLEMVNEASGKLVRFSVSDNIGKRLDDISPLLRQNQIHTVFQKAIRSGQFAEIDEFVYQPDPTDPPRLLNFRIFPLPQNRVVLLMEDITTKKRAEQNLKMTSFGIENAGDIILWVDENARLVFANGTACRKYGFSKEELMGMTLPDVDARISMMQWFEIIQILESKPSLVLESINKTKGGLTFPVEISMNKFIFDGKKNYFAFVRDINDRKRNDELEQKIQVARKSAAIKQQFLANMSHEIRTPMTGIMGMTSLLMRTNLSPAQIEYVRNIKISSENLLNIINDVLDLSKIEAGRMELKPNRIDFREFVNEIMEMFQHQATNKSLKFTSDIEPLIPAYIKVDDQRLKQVINNLLSNAFKFTDDGAIHLNFTVQKKKTKDMIIKCDVHDTGMGISDENQKQVFEKFTQIDTSLIRPFEGTGLGLAICRELSQLLGGDISVESELEKGSTFSFTFRAEFDKNDLESPVKVKNNEFKDMNLNVLHVEDKLLNQKVVGFILFNAGCNVDFVKNGREAIESYSPGKYDIILMDIQMPVMDGISAYKELKLMHGDKLCPVIGLSANALEGDAQKYISLGLDDYIVKPFQPIVLYEKLIKWAGKQNTPKSA